MLSNRAYARITSIDIAPAMAIAGVVDVVLAKDIPGKCCAACLRYSVVLASYRFLPILGENHFGIVTYDEELFATDKVFHVGQVIGVVVASTRRYAATFLGLCVILLMMGAGLLLCCFSAAMAGAKAVAVSYEDLAPASFTIDEAISNGSFFQYDRSIVTGDVDVALAAEGVQVRVYIYA